QRITLPELPDVGGGGVRECAGVCLSHWGPCIVQQVSGLSGRLMRFLRLFQEFLGVGTRHVLGGVGLVRCHGSASLYADAERSGSCVRLSRALWPARSLCRRLAPSALRRGGTLLRCSAGGCS